jgi:hypothetical protein
MYPLARRTVCTTVLAILAGCGDMPQDVTLPSAPGASAQQASFTGVADPATGRLQLVTGPEAALVTIAEDHDGNPATATAATAQVYGPSVSFVSGGVGYPAVCNPAAPMVMTAGVELFSGFTEQLRNVYARVTAVSGGQTFCSRATVPGNFTGSLTPNVGLYLYQPLDLGRTADSAIRRSVQWAMNLTDNGAFWFKGDLWAEIIPQPPTISLPADGATYRTGDPTADVQFKWTNDPQANGGTNSGVLVPRPLAVGAQLTILRCGSSAGGYLPATCTISFLAPTLITDGQYAVKVTNGYWYQWTLRAVFTLPGPSAQKIGTLLSTRSFKATT